MGIQGPAIFQVMQRFFFLQSAEALPALPHPGETEHSTPIYVTRWNPGTVELCSVAGVLWGWIGELWDAMVLGNCGMCLGIGTGLWSCDTRLGPCSCGWCWESVGWAYTHIEL